MLSHKRATLICILRKIFSPKEIRLLSTFWAIVNRTLSLQQLATTNSPTNSIFAAKDACSSAPPAPSSQTKEKERQRTINFVCHKPRGSVATVQPRLRREASETSPQGRKSLRPTVLPPFTPVSSKSPSLDRTGQDRTVRQRANGASQADTHTRTEGEGEEGEGEAEDQEDAATVLQKFPPQFSLSRFPRAGKK